MLRHLAGTFLTAPFTDGETEALSWKVTVQAHRTREYHSQDSALRPPCPTLP